MKPYRITELLCSETCQVCGGIGYVTEGFPLGHSKFGQVNFCPNVDRWTLPGAERYGLVKQEILDMDWSSIASRKNVEPVITQIESTIANGSGWVYIYGTFGVAKTFLLKATIARVLRAGDEAAYVRMATIIDNLREAFSESSNGRGVSDRNRLDWWADVPILAIDEFDRVRATEFAQDRQFILMDRRYESAIRGKSVTIMASNRAPDQLGRDGVDGYLVDRIEDGRFSVVEIKGAGYRRDMR
jgi:DNA replication protein DnaC